jgi:hypothetical protein
MPDESVNWTTVDRYYHPTEAHIAAGLVESNGIPVFLLGINHASANWLLSNALGGIQLQVPAQFVAEARDILAETNQGRANDSDTCPECGSADTSAMSNSRKIAFFSVHAFGLPVPWTNSRRHCQKCAAEWTIGEDD